MSVASPARTNFAASTPPMERISTRVAAALLIVAGEIGEDMPGRHRRKAREPQPAHALRPGAIESGKTAVRNARFIWSRLLPGAQRGKLREGY